MPMLALHRWMAIVTAGDTVLFVTYIEETAVCTATEPDIINLTAERGSTIGIAAIRRNASVSIVVVQVITMAFYRVVSVICYIIVIAPEYVESIQVKVRTMRVGKYYRILAHITIQIRATLISDRV